MADGLEVEELSVIRENDDTTYFSVYIQLMKFSILFGKEKQNPKNKKRNKENRKQHQMEERKVNHLQEGPWRKGEVSSHPPEHFTLTLIDLILAKMHELKPGIQTSVSFFHVMELAVDPLELFFIIRLHLCQALIEVQVLSLLEVQWWPHLRGVIAHEVLHSNSQGRDIGVASPLDHPHINEVGRIYRLGLEMPNFLSIPAPPVLSQMRDEGPHHNMPRVLYRALTLPKGFDVLKEEKVGVAPPPQMHVVQGEQILMSEGDLATKPAKDGTGNELVAHTKGVIQMRALHVGGRCGVGGNLPPHVLHRQIIGLGKVCRLVLLGVDVLRGYKPTLDIEIVQGGRTVSIVHPVRHHPTGWNILKGADLCAGGSGQELCRSPSVYLQVEAHRKSPPDVVDIPQHIAFPSQGAEDVEV
ncbi:hypothetical protein Fmac_001083 [Flemingia macrophylla]|uniref:Uncharacterized protein n=1 Tax=Flemingia macrophylla TaxID=520843 RepID=A0ABD1NG28_9FABA